jgi:hypothetical protein
MLGGAAVDFLIRDAGSVVATPVQRDVDGIPQWTHGDLLVPK